jgi:hypothetical protein
VIPADELVGHARRVLAEARQRPVEQMPPTLLMREVAELRRLLGQIFGVVAEQASTLEETRATLTGAAATLDEDQAATVLSALDVAAEYRALPRP